MRLHWLQARRDTQPRSSGGAVLHAAEAAPASSPVLVEAQEEEEEEVARVATLLDEGQALELRDVLCDDADAGVAVRDASGR